MKKKYIYILYTPPAGEPLDPGRGRLKSPPSPSFLLGDVHACCCVVAPPRRASSTATTKGTKRHYTRGLARPRGGHFCIYRIDVVKQKARSKKQKAETKNKKPKAKSKTQKAKAKSKEPKAKSKKQQAKSKKQKAKKAKSKKAKK